MMNAEDLKIYVQTHMHEAMDKVMHVAEKIGDKAFEDTKSGSAANTFVLNVLSLFFAQFLTAYVKNHNPRPIQELGNEIYREFQSWLGEILLKHSNGKTTFEIEIPLKKKED